MSVIWPYCNVTTAVKNLACVHTHKVLQIFGVLLQRELRGSGSSLSDGATPKLNTEDPITFGTALPREKVVTNATKERTSPSVVDSSKC